MNLKVILLIVTFGLSSMLSYAEEGFINENVLLEDTTLNAWVHENSIQIMAKGDSDKVVYWRGCDFKFTPNLRRSRWFGSLGSTSITTIKQSKNILNIFKKDNPVVSKCKEVNLINYEEGQLHLDGDESFLNDWLNAFKKNYSNVAIKGNLIVGWKEQLPNLLIEVKLLCMNGLPYNIQEENNIYINKKNQKNLISDCANIPKDSVEIKGTKLQYLSSWKTEK